jgi:hypothetical protein
MFQVKRRFDSFLPLKAANLQVIGITGLTAEQVAAITKPFVPGEPITTIAILQTFSVDCSIDTLNAPARFTLEVYLWVSGSAAKYAPISIYQYRRRRPGLAFGVSLPTITAAL